MCNFYFVRVCGKCTSFCSPDEFHRRLLVVKEIPTQTLTVWWYIDPHLVDLYGNVGVWASA